MAAGVACTSTEEVFLQHKHPIFAQFVVCVEVCRGGRGRMV